MHACGRTTPGMIIEDMKLAEQQGERHSPSALNRRRNLLTDMLHHASPLTVAVWQGQAAPSDIQENLTRVNAAMRKARSQDADVLVLPELMLCGYDIGQGEIRKLAQKQDSKAIRMTSSWAAELELAVCLPYAELGDDGHVYNSAALFDCNGTLVLNYRKTHLWSDYEKEVFAPGNELLVRDVKLRGDRSLRMGTLICFDIEFCEPARVLGLLGAQVIIVPTALGTGPADHITPMRSVPARAAENAAVVLYSNLWGLNHKVEFCGCSAIIAPDGSDLVRAGAG